MLWYSLAIVAGIALLVWSADRFVDGSSATAKYLGVSPLFIGMVVIGFGTSAPEMIVSALAALDGAPALALGNAYGSNIANIALILGTTAVIAPVAMQSQIVRKEIPILIAVSFLSFALLYNGELSRFEASCLLLVFAGYLTWAIRSAKQSKGDVLGDAMALEIPSLSKNMGYFWVAAGLLLLIGSSRLLVWGAVGAAEYFGVSDLIIGLTVVAIGTSLPELASSIVAARKGEHDIALGNVIGSNFFNTLVVVGIAGMIAPAPVAPDLLTRDIPVMLILTSSLIALALRGRNRSEISRGEGAVLVSAFVAYNTWLIFSSM